MIEKAHRKMNPLVGMFYTGVTRKIGRWIGEKWKSKWKFMQFNSTRNRRWSGSFNGNMLFIYKYWNSLLTRGCVGEVNKYYWLNRDLLFYKHWIYADFYHPNLFFVCIQWILFTRWFCVEGGISELRCFNFITFKQFHIYNMYFCV